MTSSVEHLLDGIYFFNRLKKKDAAYIHRLIQRYYDIMLNAEKTAQLSEIEMFEAYLELMDTAIDLYLSQGA